MKKSMWFSGLFAFVVVLVLTAPAMAQQDSFTIHVPFSFNVNAHVLPAGEYRIGIVVPGEVQIRGIDHIVNTFFAAPRVSRSLHGPLNAKLVFNCYGRQYFLSRVWFGNAGTGYELWVSNTEREYAQQIPKTDTELRAAK